MALLLSLITTGLIGKARKKCEPALLPKPVMLVLAEAAAFAAAYVMKMVVSGILGEGLSG